MCLKYFQGTMHAFVVCWAKWGCFCLWWPLGAQRIPPEAGDIFFFLKKLHSTTSFLLLFKTLMKVHKKVFFYISTLCGVAFACMFLLSANSNSKSECMHSSFFLPFFLHVKRVHTRSETHTHTLSHWLLRRSCCCRAFILSVCIH